MAQANGATYSARRGGTPGEETGAAYGWSGATLRPTGVVVFATLEPPRARPVRFTPALRDGIRRPALAPGASPLDLEEAGAPVPVAAGDPGHHRWRRRVGLGANWLLGR